MLPNPTSPETLKRLQAATGQRTPRVSLLLGSKAAENELPLRRFLACGFSARGPGRECL